MVPVQQSFTAKTEAIPETVLYTPALDGMYKLSLYATAADTNNQHGLRVNVTFADAYQQRSQLSVLSIFGSGVGAVTVPIFCRAGQPVSISTSPSGTLASPYNLYAAIEDFSI